MQAATPIGLVQTQRFPVRCLHDSLLCMVSVICSAPKDLIAVFLVVVAGGGHERMEGFVPFYFPSANHYLMRFFGGTLISVTSCEFKWVVAEGPDAGFAAPGILARPIWPTTLVFIGGEKKKITDFSGAVPRSNFAPLT